MRWRLLALGDPTRRAIVECLAERPCAVGELAAELPVSRPAVSQALKKVLKDAGLVTERAAGTRRIYRLNFAAWPIDRHGPGWQAVAEGVGGHDQG